MLLEELTKLIGSVKRNLIQGRYQNESAIREAVVMPILERLGWDTIDPMVVRREHPIQDRRVDYCLCAHESKPDVLIEVKREGSIQGGDLQLFEYAFHAGVPMALLTDGGEWSFYLPAGQGSYDDRRVYKLDLREHEAEDCCRVLLRYLAFERVKLRQAMADARADYDNASQKQTAAITLSKAWNKLVAESSSELIDMLSSETQTLCGYAPTRDQVEMFLGTLTSASDKIVFAPKGPRAQMPSPASHPIGEQKPPERPTGGLLNAFDQGEASKLSLVANCKTLKMPSAG